MQKIESFVDKYIFVLALIICIPAVWALFVPGYFGASDDLHVAWLYEMDKVVKIGQIPPRFVPDLSYQFGYPLFNFVFPLPFYIGELFHLAGLNFVASIKTVFLISMPLSFIFIYKLLRHFTNPVLSLIGATIYIYTPYRATDIYVRGAIGEIVSFIFFPLICLSIFKILEEKKMKWVGIGGLSIAGLVLTHNIAAYMFLPAMILLAAILLFSTTKKFENSMRFLAAITLGMLISLYFWLPAIIDSKLMKYDTVFNFIDHFPTLRQLITPFWGYGASVAGPYDGMSFFIGIFNWILVFGGLVIIFLKWKNIKLQQKIIVIWGYLVFLITIFLMNFRSAFLWESIPNLAYFQFPWRFLMLTTFITPLLIILFDQIKLKQKWLYLIVVFLIVGINAFQFRPHDFLGRDDQYYLNKYIPYPAAFDEYKLTQEEYLRLPVGTTTRPDKIYPPVWINVEEFLPVIQDGLDGKVTTNFTQPEVLSYNKYNFPGWIATIDGETTSINTGQPFGQITILVPTGNHQVEIKFQETSFKLLLNIISLLALILAILLAASSYFKKAKN